MLHAFVVCCATSNNLVWSVQPTSITSLTSHYQGWVDCDETTVDFSLDSEHTVRISYVATVISERPYLPGGDFVRSQLVAEDVLGMRLVVDGTPYRQSGSHVNPKGASESSRSSLMGHVLTDLSRGNHTATLQWRRWGTNVRSWSIRPFAFDGQGGGRSLLVRTGHKYLYFAQPLSGAKIASDVWTDVGGCTLSFSLPRPWEMRILYSLPVLPYGAPNGNVLSGSPDYIGARVNIDGIAYRESGSLFKTVTHSYSNGILAGEMVLDLAPGSHVIKLQWRKWGEQVPLWMSQPSMYEGFVCGRTLLVEGEHTRVSLVHPLQSTTLNRFRLSELGSVGVDGWFDIPGTVVQVRLVSMENSLQINFAVSLSNLGRTDFDSWSFERWSALSIRLVVDNDVLYGKFENDLLL